MLNNPDLYILRETWREYTTHCPVSQNGYRKSLISAWREYAWIIESAWKGFMQRALPPVSWNFLSESIERRTYLRQIWLREGGWLLTKRGTRRKRHFKGQKQPRVSRIQDEVNEAYRLFRESVDAETLTRVDIALLSVSGVLYCGDGKSRKRTVDRFRNTWNKLDFVKARLSDVPAEILQLPWRRKRLR